MTPKEKAEELINRYLKCNFKYSDYEGDKWTKEFSIHEAKQCVLIAVGEMIDEIECIYELYNIKDSYVAYWLEVENEIKKL